MIDKNDFFREFTIRICSSLSIKAALAHAFEYLKEVMPLDMAGLIKRDESLKALRCIARVTSDQYLYDEIIPIPDHLWISNPNFWELRGPCIIDEKEAFQHEMAVLTGVSGHSHLLVPLWVDRKILGCLSLVATEGTCFDQSHVDLVDTIAQPAAIAFANALAHEDVVRYRDTLIDDNRFLKKELQEISMGDIIGADGGLRPVLELVRQVAPLKNTVLLTGETGTGKEVIANAIHFASHRKDGPFIKVNCGAIPESLIDSELFGHEKGAFTGATAEKRGRFERANGGTIFLDEIGELPHQAQIRLLRVLQNREIERVGGTKQIPVDIRVIAATHRNLETMVSQGSFREDLWFRLNVFPLMIPPLRQRKEDIPVLTRYFLERKSAELGLRTPPSVAPGALNRLMEYPWPGNVRELENLVERELIRFRGGYLTFETLTPLKATAAPIVETKGEDLEGETDLDEIVRAHIEKVLASTGGRIQGAGGAAELLGIKATTLRARMDKLGIAFRRK
jgi:transcriptional regulator with GAF, ATPase, and Fis domain